MNIADFEESLAKAVYSVLSAGLSSSVHDYVPQPGDASLSSPDFPYTTIGETTAQPFDTDEDTGAECTISLHHWSRYKGYKELREIRDACYALLNRQDAKTSALYVALEALGIALISCEWEFNEQPFMDPDGVTRHAVQRFRVLLSAA